MHGIAPGASCGGPLPPAEWALPDLPELGLPELPGP